jgi:hypothetical protein
VKDIIQIKKFFKIMEEDKLKTEKNFPKEDL